MKNAVWVLLLLFSQATAQKGKLEVVQYNNPELTVDLGVGLWAVPLPMDYDGDGNMDLLVSCHDKPYHGVYYFKNLTGGPNPVFAQGIRLHDGLRYVQVSYIDNQPRLLVPGNEIKDFRQSWTVTDSLFSVQEITKDLSKAPRFNQWKMVDYDGDGDADIIVGVDDWVDYGWDNAYNNLGQWTNGPLHGYVYLIENDNGNYINRGRLQAGGKDIDVFGAPSPSFADYDGDGDLDLICGEFVDRFTWFENIGTRQKPVYAPGRFLTNSVGEIRMDLQMIVPVGVDFDKDGHVDLVVGDEDGRVALIRNTGRVKNNMPVFESPVYFKQQAANLKFGALVTPVSVDWDDDGDEDIIAGNSAGYIAFIENLGIHNGAPKWAAPVLLQAGNKTFRVMAGQNGSIQGPVEAKWGYTTLSVADWDGDGLKDIIFNSIWGKVEWMKNIGKKGVPKLAAPMPVKIDWASSNTPKPVWNWWQPNTNELVTQWRTTPYAIDWNKDGLTDLVMLDQEGFLNFYARKKVKKELILTPGKRIFYGSNASIFDSNHRIINDSTGLLKLNNRLNGGSGRRKFTIADWNNDGLPDLLVNSVNASVLYNKGSQNGRWYFEEGGTLSEHILAGHDTSPTPVNWGPEWKGLLIGAEDGHFYFLKR